MIGTEEQFSFARGPSRKPVSIDVVVAFVVVVALVAPSAAGVELVRDGKPLASIIIPAEPLPVESYAAKELQYHVESASGVELPIVSENQAIPAGDHVYLGRCQAATAAKVDPSSLPGSGYVIKTTGRDIYLAGKDSRGDPLGLDTHEGTLFGVYDLLESHLGVRWLWPGKLGEVIPRQQNLSLAPADGSVKPRLWFKQWRGGSTTYYSASEQASRIKAKRKYGAGTYGPFYLLAGEIYTPHVMTNAWHLLEKARTDAAPESVPAARVEWLARGLKQADLMLETERAHERAVDTGDKTEFLAAYQALKDFRKANADYDKSNFLGLGGSEMTWEKASR